MLGFARVTGNGMMCRDIGFPGEFAAGWLARKSGVSEQLRDVAILFHAQIVLFQVLYIRTMAAEPAADVAAAAPQESKASSSPAPLSDRESHRKPYQAPMLLHPASHA